MCADMVSSFSPKFSEWQWSIVCDALDLFADETPDVMEAEEAQVLAGIISWYCDHEFKNDDPMEVYNGCFD